MVGVAKGAAEAAVVESAEGALVVGRGGGGDRGGEEGPGDGGGRGGGCGGGKGAGDGGGVGGALPTWILIPEIKLNWLS